MTEKMKLEICASNYQSALNAQEVGAHRIELCEKLSVGGLTPSEVLIENVLKALKIPIFVLIRPRQDNFVYSKDEFNQMTEDIKRFKTWGVSGMVSGVLNSNNTIDTDRTKVLIELTKPLPFTFHRAYDVVSNPLEALEQLVDLGADRILTSGQQNTAEQGYQLLKQLKEKAENRISILPGSGINPSNVNLFKQAGFTEIHASATGDGNVSRPEIITAILNIINA